MSAVLFRYDRLRLVTGEVTGLRFPHHPLWSYSPFVVQVSIVLKINLWCQHSWCSGFEATPPTWNLL